MMTDVDIPVAQDSVKSFFDEDIDDLALMDAPLAVPVETDDSDYAWIEQKNDNGLKKVLFDFDKWTLKGTQKEAAAFNAQRIRDIMATHTQEGKKVKFVINGNSDHAAGSDEYNRILSNKRAKVLEDYLVANGVPRHTITSVGRGSDIPEIINGKPCTGSIDQQAPNRRDEIQLIIS